jgi:hypothetical protein
MSHNVNVRISSLKKNPAENYMAPDTANFLIRSLKKNPAKNYRAPDTANFLHELPQKESEGRLWLQILPTFCISFLKKNPAKNYMAPDPRQLSSSVPLKRIRLKIIWLQIPPILSSAP